MPACVDGNGISSCLINYGPASKFWGTLARSHCRDPNEEKWLYQKLDPWMSWGLAPREFEEPVYQKLEDFLGANSETSSAPASEISRAMGAPPVPSTLNRAPIATLNRGPIKPPTVTVVNAGGGGLINAGVPEDRELIPREPIDITSVSGHFE